MNEWLDSLVRATQESIAAEATLFPTQNTSSALDNDNPQFLRDSLILPDSAATQEPLITILTMTASYMTLEEVIGQSISRNQINFVLGQHKVESILTNCALFMAVLQNERSAGREDAQRQLAESSLRGSSRERALRLLDSGQRVFVAPQAVLGVMKMRLMMDDSWVTDSQVVAPEVATVMAILGLAGELGNINREPQNELGGLPKLSQWKYSLINFSIVVRTLPLNSPVTKDTGI